MKVPQHLAMQSEALVILLQETHCTDAEKLVLPNYQLAGSSLSRKHGLATRLSTSDWDTRFWTNLHRHRRSSGCVWTLMVIKYSTSTNHRQRDYEPWISQCFLTPILTLAILSVIMLTGVTMTTVRTVSAWLAGQVLIVLPSYIMPRSLPVFIPAAGTLAPIQI